MILLSFLGTFCVLLRNTEALRPDLRAYRWRHNNPKEDPITRRRFKAGIHGHDLIEKILTDLYHESVLMIPNVRQMLREHVMKNSISMKKWSVNLPQKDSKNFIIQITQVDF